MENSPPMKLSNKQSKKKVLISYIKSPFYFKKRTITHSNVIEMRKILECFEELNFSVDVVDWQYRRKIYTDKYDLIFGFGYPLFNSLEKFKGISICYLTGSNPNYSNEMESKRISYFFKEKGIALKARREISWPWKKCAIESDFLIVTGNEFSKETYKCIREDLYSIKVPFIDSINSTEQNDNNGFLWFGGAGALFKGLDLTIDAFKELSSNSSLDICGPIYNETDFMNFYRKDFALENINFHGMIDPSSIKMKNLLKKNKFVILPSCSEGGASSVLTCMRMGLIPLVTEQCCIDLKNFGYKINDLTKKSVFETMIKALNTDDKNINEQRLNIQKYLYENHAANIFKKNLKKILLEITDN